MAASDQFSEQQVREYKEAFGFFNSINSRDTELSVEEIYDVMARFEPHREIDTKEVQAMIREVDTDDTGNLDFPKFLKVMSRTARPTESLTDQEDLMMDAFSFFAEQGGDADSFGAIELVKIMELMNESLTDDEIHEMMAFLDPNGTGRVTYEDFLEVVKKM